LATEDGAAGGWTLPPLLRAGLELALNQALALDEDSPARLAPLAGKVVALELVGLGLTLHLAVDPGGVRVLGDYRGRPDVVLRGTPVALARLGAGDRRRALFAGEVRMEGDLEAGRRFEALLAELDIDWEEHLARWIGDAPAHQLGNLVRGLRRWVDHARGALARQLGEYLREESGQLPSRAQVQAFLDAVDRLREDAERLEARVRRLEARRGRPEEGGAGGPGRSAPGGDGPRGGGAGAGEAGG